MSASQSNAVKLLGDANVKHRVTLIEKVDITHDTRRFRFALPTKEHVLGLPTGSHIFLSTTVNGEPCTRPYTPVSSDDDHGYVDFVIKVYFKDVNPQFPEGGKMTQHLESLAIGDSVEIRGPFGNFDYRGRGVCAIRESRQAPHQVFTVRRLGLIAGGTGLTPILQVVRRVLKDEGDSTEMWVLFANRTEHDILLRDELDRIAETYRTRVHVWYTVSEADENWTYSVGHINADMLREHMPPAADDTLILMCGPPAMVNSACKPNLEALNHAKERCFAF